MTCVAAAEAAVEAAAADESVPAVDRLAGPDQWDDRLGYMRGR